MDIVLVGLPGQRQERRGQASGPSPRRGLHRPRRTDRARGRPLHPRRSSRRTARRPSGPWSGGRSPTWARPTPAPQVRRVIATGGGAVVDPRNRWALYRGRLSVWLDGRPEVLAQRLRRSPARPSTGHGPRPDRHDPRPGHAPRAVLRRGRPSLVRRDRGHGRRRGDRSPPAPRRRRSRQRPCCGRRPRSAVCSSATGSRRPAWTRRSAGSRPVARSLVSEPGAWAAVGAVTGRRPDRRGLGGDSV